MISTSYYYYYLFYKKILKDSEPHMLATMVLGFSFSLPIIGLIAITIAYLFNEKLSNYAMFGINLLMIVVLYFTLYRTGKAREIVKQKPMFFNSHVLSILITVLFFVITTSFLFWEPGYIRFILETRSPVFG